MDMKLEVVVLPVGDGDRAKQFYETLGWRLDADFAAGIEQLLKHAKIDNTLLDDILRRYKLKLPKS